MIFGSLKTKIAVNLSILLLIAMFLIDFIAVSTSQREVLRSETARGDLLVGMLKKSLMIPVDGDMPFRSLSHHFSEMPFLLSKLDNTSVLILDHAGKEIYSYYPNSKKEIHLPSLIRQSMSSGEKLNEFLGETWGVFWKQNQSVLITEPVYDQGKVIAGIGVAITMDLFYEGLRQSQQVVILYLLLNVILFSMFGFYRIYKIAVKPIHRLVKRAEEYSDDTQAVFKVEKEEDEFSQLSTALNHMLNRISDDKETLKKSLDSLEKANLEIQKAQNEIIRAEKLASVGRLSAGIAHEIGNPIGIVLGYLGLLKQETITEDERTDYIHRAENEIQRINTIIRQLLDFSRPSNQEKAHVAVHDIIDEVMNIVSVQPVMRDVDIVKFFKAEKNEVQADPNLLRQVFLNLLINAADAIAHSKNQGNGKITIHTGIDADSITDDFQLKMLCIKISDNGLGISPDYLKNVFDPFFTTKEPGKGTGLGLSVCFRIIEELGGSISAYSEEGEGTTMIINLPLTQ